MDNCLLDGRSGFRRATGSPKISEWRVDLSAFVFDQLPRQTIAVGQHQKIGQSGVKRKHRGQRPHQRDPRDWAKSKVHVQTQRGMKFQGNVARR